MFNCILTPHAVPLRYGVLPRGPVTYAFWWGVGNASAYPVLIEATVPLCDADLSKTSEQQMRKKKKKVTT